jgi:hypothetical protein
VAITGIPASGTAAAVGGATDEDNNRHEESSWLGEALASPNHF